MKLRYTLTEPMYHATDIVFASFLADSGIDVKGAVFMVLGLSMHQKMVRTAWETQK